MKVLVFVTLVRHTLVTHSLIIYFVLLPMQVQRYWRDTVDGDVLYRCKLDIYLQNILISIRIYNSRL